MRDYAKVSPRFWTGETGRSLRGKERLQVMAAYLISCPNSNWLGYYYLPLPTISHETGCPIKGAMEALRSLEKALFCCYNAQTEHVWVIEMAGWQISNRLKPDDHRVLGIKRELETLKRSGFYDEFVTHYADRFGIGDLPHEHRPLEGPCKPLQSQEQEQEQKQKQEQERDGGKQKILIPEERRQYGEFGHVILTDAEYSKLKTELNGHTQTYIEDFDRWVHEAPDAKANGVRRRDRNPYASIRQWYSRNVREGKVKQPRKPTDKPVFGG